MKVSCRTHRPKGREEKGSDLLCDVDSSKGHLRPHRRGVRETVALGRGGGIKRSYQ